MYKADSQLVLNTDYQKKYFDKMTFLFLITLITESFLELLNFSALTQYH
jgi:hypothetical protein